MILLSALVIILLAIVAYQNQRAKKFAHENNDLNIERLDLKTQLDIMEQEANKQHKLDSLNLEIINNDRIVCFDVDNTLVIHDFSSTYTADEIIIIEHNGKDNAVVAYEPHVAALKKHKAAGDFVIVWSQSGAEWAKKVVQSLELENDVNMILIKPYQCYDDSPAGVWMKNVFLT
jgi:hypothetical protein